MRELFSNPQYTPETLASLEKRFPIKRLDLSTDESFKKFGPQLLEIENTWDLQHRFSLRQLKARVRGAIVEVMYDGDRMIGDAMTRTEVEPKGNGRILQALPPESLNADGTVVHPYYRGKGLQKLLLLSRLKLAREYGKETILSCVRLEHGASLRNIMFSGARIFAYCNNYFPESHNTARVIWENDLKAQAGPEEKLEKKDGEFPDVVIKVKSGDLVDQEAQKKIEEILSQDYVGISVQAEENDAKILESSKIVFRHLSNFPPSVTERLRERKQRILAVLKATDAR